MHKDNFDSLKSLHTGEIDARNGYEEALVDAEGAGLTQLFRDMLQLHELNAEQLAGVLRDAGETASSDGSFMSVVHRAIMNVRSLFSGLGDSVLPGLIDGERRNVERYDKALATPGLSAPVENVLRDQRSKIQQKIGYMEQQKTAALQD